MRVCFAHRTLNAGKICLFVCFRLIQILHGSTTQQKSCCWFQRLFLTHWLWPRSLWPCHMWELFIHLWIVQRSTAQAEEKFLFFKMKDDEVLLRDSLPWMFQDHNGIFSGQKLCSLIKVIVRDSQVSLSLSFVYLGTLAYLGL